MPMYVRPSLLIHFNQLMTLYKTWYEHHFIREHTVFVPFDFLLTWLHVTSPRSLHGVSLIKNRGSLTFHHKYGWVVWVFFTHFKVKRLFPKILLLQSQQSASKIFNPIYSINFHLPYSHYKIRVQGHKVTVAILWSF